MLILNAQIFYINQKNDKIKLCKSIIDIEPENVTDAFVLNSLPQSFKDDIKLLENIKLHSTELIL